MRLLFAVTLLVLVSVSGRAQTPDRSGVTRDGDFGPFTVEIDYEETRGDLRKARLSLTPASRDGARPWNGTAEHVVLITDKGTGHVVDDLLSSGHQTGIVYAEALLPPPESVVLILFHSSRDPWRGWQLGDGYANMEVSYADANGRSLRSGPCAPDDCFAHVMPVPDRVERSASQFRLSVGPR